MASKTEFLGLTKPSLDDFYNIEDFNNNFQKIDNFLKNIGAKIATGTYVGTNESGSGNPNTLTFEFQPKYIVIRGVQTSSTGGNLYSLELFYGKTYHHFTTANGVDIVATWTGNTVSWYAENERNQLNSSTMTYYYVAIG